MYFILVNNILMYLVLKVNKEKKFNSGFDPKNADSRLS